MKHNIYKLSIVMLIVLLLSACVAQNQLIQVPLAKSVLVRQMPRHFENFEIKVSNTLPTSAGLGGSNGVNNISFQGVVPWLNNQLSVLNNNPCIEAMNKKITLHIKLNKLYANINSDYLVGQLVLLGKFKGQNQILLTRYYDANCVSSFFSLGTVSSLQQCFNTAMSKIIFKINNDICRIKALR